MEILAKVLLGIYVLASFLLIVLSINCYVMVFLFRRKPRRRENNFSFMGVHADVFPSPFLEASKGRCIKYVQSKDMGKERRRSEGLALISSPFLRSRISSFFFFFFFQEMHNHFFGLQEERRKREEFVALVFGVFHPSPRVYYSLSYIICLQILLWHFSLRMTVT